jgi:hypothetical protein
MQNNSEHLEFMAAAEREDVNDLSFMTLSEIAAGMYRHNATATEYAMAVALYKRLPEDQKRLVIQKGEANYIIRGKVA